MNDMHVCTKEEEGSRRTFVGTLFELLVLGSLIDELQNLISRGLRDERMKVEEKKPEKRKKKYLIVQLG